MICKEVFSESFQIRKFDNFKHRHHTLLKNNGLMNLIVSPHLPPPHPQHFLSWDVEMDTNLHSPQQCLGGGGGRGWGGGRGSPFIPHPL